MLYKVSQSFALPMVAGFSCKKAMWCFSMHSEPCNCTLAYRKILTLQLLSCYLGGYHWELSKGLHALRAAGFSHTLSSC